MKDLRENQISLRMDIYRDRNVGALSTSQPCYSATIIEIIGKQNARGIMIPAAPAIGLTLSSPACEKPYR